MTRSCEQCGKAFESSAATAKYCTAKCRKGAFRRRHDQVVPGRSGTVERGGTADGGGAEAAVRAELDAAGRLNTYLGASAVALAMRIDSSTAVMGFAALVKELRVTMEAAMAGVKVEADPVDELRSRRDRKLAG